ncbi:MAG TPA: dephospho-CoA kinase [Candidatus Sulfotelmatobacter sp.]|nr:dephospho-CoA kinase [Candidatus Sulfotelmatobacter sp.]
MSTRSGRRTVRIGLTGPIGCGKSTVAGWLAERGAVVIDADAVARQVTDEPAVRAAIVAAFGPSVAGPDGGLDRGALATTVFDDPAALARLEALTHPGVRPRVEAAVAAAEAAGAPAVIMEAIKLVEAGLAAACDEVWLVTCEPAMQAARLAGRGVAAADATRRVAAQGDIRARLASAATRVLSTDGSPDEARARALAAYEAALAAYEAAPAAYEAAPGP